MKKYLVSCFLILIAITAHAVKPVSGSWFNPDESGRGLTIEVRNGILLATFFGYNQDGTPTFWQGVGTESVPGSGVFTGNFGALIDGQCTGCDYVFPDADPNNDLGAFTLTFTNSQEAVLSWAEGDTPFELINFAFAQELSYTMGAFMFTALDNFGQIRFSEIYLMDSLNSDFSEGRQSGSFLSSDAVVVATFEGFDEAGRMEFGFLRENATATQSILFLVNLDADRLTGKYWLFPKGTEPEGDGEFVHGYKIYDQYEIINGAGDEFGNGLIGAKQSMTDTKEIPFEQGQGPAPERIIKLANKLANLK